MPPYSGQYPWKQLAAHIQLPCLTWSTMYCAHHSNLRTVLCPLSHQVHNVLDVQVGLAQASSIGELDAIDPLQAGIQEREAREKNKGEMHNSGQ